MEELTQVSQIATTLVDFCVRYSFQIIGAIITLCLGIFVASWLSRLVMRLCEKRNIDVTLTHFIGQIVKLLILVLVIIMTLGKFGISVAPLIAALGAVAFGASFALQGPLSNYGAGISIIMSRPFIVGNTISLLGISGVVESVTLAATVLSTEDGEQITIPNKKIVGEILINSFENKIVETKVGISYGDDPEKAIDLIRMTLATFSSIPTEPAPQIGIEAYADSSIAIGLRYWVPTRDYFKIVYSVNMSIHKVFKENTITIPFPQRDVRIVSQKGTPPMV